MRDAQLTPNIFTLFVKGYSRSELKSDIFAGLTVAIVALPLAMALAIASGASPDKGLITSIIAGFFISLLGGSRVQIGGPTGAFVVLIFHVISTQGYDGLILATMMAGILLLIAGYARLGQVIKFIPYPVITGFTAGIAVIIASSQIKDFLGLKMAEIPVEFIPKWLSYFHAFDTVTMSALAIGLLSLGMILVLRRLAPKFPAYLIAIVTSATIVSFFQISVETIGSRFPDIAVTISMPEFPDWNFARVQELIPSALAIAFLAGIEALLSAMVADGMTGDKHRPNQELVGQGVANIASALFGGLPATGAIARTATNIEAGAKTPMAGIFHAIFILFFVLLAQNMMAFIPLATLAAILFVVALGMSERHHFIAIMRVPGSDKWIMIVTFLLTILVDLMAAIVVGVILSALFFIKHMEKTVKIQPKRYNSEGMQEYFYEYIKIFQITGPFFFAVSGNLLDLLNLKEKKTCEILILDMKYVAYLDSTGNKILKLIIEYCKNNKIQLVFNGLLPQPMTMLTKTFMNCSNTHLHMVSDDREACELVINYCSQNLLLTKFMAHKGSSD